MKTTLIMIMQLQDTGLVFIRIPYLAFVKMERELVIIFCRSNSRYYKTFCSFCTLIWPRKPEQYRQTGRISLSNQSCQH
jgi:hypothetical protein